MGGFWLSTYGFLGSEQERKEGGGKGRMLPIDEEDIAEDPGGSLSPSCISDILICFQVWEIEPCPLSPQKTMMCSRDAPVGHCSEG